jgi:CRISPR/Cas system CSM-associated protein Csm5 (group 7 of RAMP superfamily)
VAKFYRQLANASLPPNQALLQLGWGAGWDGKTFWTHLQKDADLFDQLVSDFHMQKAGRGAPLRRRGEPFPRSKRAVMKVLEGRATALAPMGWGCWKLATRKDKAMRTIITFLGKRHTPSKLHIPRPSHPGEVFAHA